MSSIEDYLARYPQQTQRLIGIKFDQFQELVQKAESFVKKNNRHARD